MREVKKRSHYFLHYIMIKYLQSIIGISSFLYNCRTWFVVHCLWLGYKSLLKAFANGLFFEKS